MYRNDATPGLSRCRCLPFARSVLLPLLILGCADVGEKPRIVPAGRIEGIIQAGGVPVTAEVIATLVAGTPGSEIQIGTAAKPDGTFRIDAPVGDYILSLQLEGGDYYYSAKGPVLSWHDADTLVVRPGEAPRHIEFPIGGLEVRISGYSIPTGRTCELELWRSGSTRAVTIRGKSDSGVLSFASAGFYPGIYRLKLRIPISWGEEDFWLPSTRDESLADSIRIDAGRTASYERSVWVSLSHLRGEVVGSWQELGGPPEIAIITADSLLAAREYIQNQDGSFDVGMRLPEPVKIRVDIESVQSWVGGGSFHDATLFNLAPGQTIDGIHVVESGLRIRMQQVDPGESWSGTMTLVDAATRRVVADLDFGISGLQEILPVSNLHSGGYLLRVSPEFLTTDCLAEWYEHAGSMEGATTITIPNEGDIVPVTVLLDRGARIVGSVETARDDPSFYYAIYVTRADSMGVLGATGLDRDAAVSPFPFTVMGLPDGDFKLGVSRWSAQADTVWYPGTADWDSAATIAIRGHADVGGIVIPYP